MKAMEYRLAECCGDSVAVPQVVFSHLAQADGDTVRVALFLLNRRETDPSVIAKALGLPSVEAARRALQFWAGAGLLERAGGKPKPEELETTEQKAARIDLASLNDPFVAVLTEEAQMLLGKALSRSEMQRLVALYLDDGWKPDVILLACTEVARRGRHTVGAVARELAQWQKEGVETGEDAERHLKRLKLREDWIAETARLFNADPGSFSKWERGAICRWHEEWHYGADLIDEALLHADAHRTVRYVDGILRAWRAQGVTTVAAARGQGQLSGSNVLATRRQPQTAPPKKDLFNRDWYAVFDDDTEG